MKKRKIPTVSDILKTKKSFDDIEMTEIDQRLLGRLAKGKTARKCLIYPDDNIRTIWDFISTM